MNCKKQAVEVRETSVCLWENLDRSGSLRETGRIYKWMARKLEVTLWTGFVWLTIRPNGGFKEQGNKHQGLCKSQGVFK
jgi:hypothetical protein